MPSSDCPSRVTCLIKMATDIIEQDVLNLIQLSSIPEKHRENLLRNAGQFIQPLPPLAQPLEPFMKQVCNVTVVIRLFRQILLCTDLSILIFSLHVL